MKWLVPLGLLGLIGLILLLIIYVIKPNYQKKVVSSTFIWKLSLNYRKRRHPISRFRDILLLLCQIFVITACALTMAQPVLEAFRPQEITQKIAVIDGSASMLATSDGETRFERAVKEVKLLAEDVTKTGGELSVILAGASAEFISVRTKTETLPTLISALDELAEKTTENCCYKKGDEKGAMKLAEQVLEETPLADVLFYTSKNYIDKGDVTVVNVSDPTEYNVAILDSVAILVENYYTFSVEIASYGRAADLELFCELSDINGTEEDKTFQLPVWLESDVVQTVLFNAETTGSDGIFSYKDAYIYVSVNDSFYYDNTFYIYGGTKETIKIQYASSVPNIFFRGCILSLRDTLKNKWNIEFDEINTNYKEPKTSGYDFYIYESVTPNTMPNDGVVMFVNPSSVPQGTGIMLSDSVRSGNMTLSTLNEHPITDGLISENILVTQCRKMMVDEDYEVLLSCYRAEPAFAVKNTDEQKVIVMAFELQNSDLSLLMEFPKLFLHTFHYFFPSTLSRYNYEVGESVTLNARAPSLKVSGQGTELTLTDFPQEITLSVYGSYTLSQTLMNGKTVLENLYVKIPNAESDFTTYLEELTNPYVATVPENKDYDLLLFLAGAIVLCLFAEWELHSRMQ